MDINAEGRIDEGCLDPIEVLQLLFSCIKGALISFTNLTLFQDLLRMKVNLVEIGHSSY